MLVDLRPVKARSARGTYHGSLRDRQGVLGATLYQEQLLLPGSMSDADGAPVTGKVAQVGRAEPGDFAAERRAHWEHPAGR